VVKLKAFEKFATRRTRWGPPRRWWRAELSKGLKSSSECQGQTLAVADSKLGMSSRRSWYTLLSFFLSFYLSFFLSVFLSFHLCTALPPPVSVTSSS